MQHYVVSSGTSTITKSTSDTYTVNGSGALYISSGGLVKNTYADASGYIRVFKGGIGSHSYITSGGKLQLESGGTTLQDAVSSGGRYYVYTSGVAKGLTIYSGGTATVFGGTAPNADIAGGTLVLSSVTSGSDYSYAYAPVLESDGLLIVQSGAMTLEARISSGASMRVSYGGLVSSTIVSSRGLFDNTGSAFDTVVSSGGRMFVSSGGYASNTKVISGGSVITSKGARTFATSASGGMLDLEGSSFNGTYSNSIINVRTSGGYSLNESFYGTLGKLTVSGSGTTSGSVESATVGSGASVVLEGGRFSGIVRDGATFTIASGIAEVKSATNASALRVTVSNGIFWGASCFISAAYIVSGGSMNLTNSALVTSANVTKGRVNLLSGAVVSGADIGKNGAIGVSSGGRLNSGTVGGTLETALGASTTSMTVVSGGTANIGGTANRMDVSGGRLTVESGGLVNFAGFAGGGMGVVFGTLGSGTVSSGGGTLYVSGGIVSEAFISAAARLSVNGGSVSSAHITSGGTMTVNSGGKVIAGGIYGSAVVDSGGTVANMGVGYGGYLQISGGGVGSKISLVSASASVQSGGSFVSCSVSQGGSVTMNKGAIGLGCTVSNGGVMQISSGVLYNGYKVLNGGKITGYYDCSVTTFSSGAIADINIYNISAGNTTAPVNLLSYAMNKGVVFTLTVSASQTKGTYKLGSYATGFNETITVQNIYGDKRGTLSVGQVVDIGGTNYRLFLDNDNTLSVTVGAAVPAGTAKSDVDGNGISDVMFVWTGNNYAHGYWMNGTNEWRSANSNHPAEWVNLGCYDMAGDGKADSVLFGNVTSEAGIHGAYIGYYADAIDNPDGSTWVNIGYLNNVDNIDWKNKVGNLTGNASGANSIVWYTYELGALGAWTDGKENWVSIGSGFDASWTLIGCGDFNGDGKDQVVMAHNSGEEYHAIDIDGTWTNLGASDSGWEVSAIGDFAGDGKDDIVAFHKETGIVAMWGDGLASNWSQLGQLDAKDWFVVGTGDYNGDAKDDLLVRQISTGMLGYYSSGSMSNWNTLGYGVDMSWTVIA